MLSKHKKYIAPLLVMVFALLAAGLVFAARLYQFGQGSNDNTENQEQLTKTYFSINGNLVDEAQSKTRPMAVMIENHSNSRPQSGLAEAEIVYETLAEGGITRFVALFQTNEAQSIGPVRSARDYFASIAEEYGAVYAHVGGSDEVLAQLNKNYYRNVTDLNEYFNGTYFQRLQSRPAPHNVYTSTEKIKQFIEDKDINNKADLTTWMFTDQPLAVENKSAESIAINFSQSSYKVGYTYDSTNSNYVRSLAGLPHLDATSKKQLTAKTVVVQFVDVSAIEGDEKDRIDIDLSGTGEALIFHDGTVTKAKWNKIGRERTMFTDLSGQPIQFNRGQMWIELVPNDSPNSRVTWKTLTPKQ
jgi:hypothetical protein